MQFSVAWKLRSHKFLTETWGKSFRSFAAKEGFYPRYWDAGWDVCIQAPSNVIPDLTNHWISASFM